MGSNLDQRYMPDMKAKSSPTPEPKHDPTHNLRTRLVEVSSEEVVSRRLLGLVQQTVQLVNTRSAENRLKRLAQRVEKGTGQD